MKAISSWRELEAYGIDLLTAESCGLGLRYLCDVTEKGKKILQRLFDVPSITFSEAWNRGSKEEPHVGSILLTHDMLTSIAVFALLETGCTEVWVLKNKAVVGIEASDTEEELKIWQDVHAPFRRLKPQGTAGDRNVHLMTGRTQ